MAVAAHPVGIDRMLSEVRHWLTELGEPLLLEFLKDWPGGAPLREIHSSPVPVMRYVPMLSALAPDSIAPLVRCIVEQASHFEWRRSYQPPAVSTHFAENYGWTEWLGLKGPIPSEQLAVGLLLLGPDVYYPWHRHEAEELYIPLAGRAAWKHADAPWREQSPGTVIHHKSFERHAMQTKGEPMLALYLWRSTDLNQRSQLDGETDVSS